MSNQNYETKSNGFNRREALIGMGGLAAMAIAGDVFAAEKKEMTHGHSKGKHEGLVDASLSCIKKGLACIDHCMESFKTGDTTFAAATDIQQETLVLCNTLLHLASYNSKYLKGFAQVCVEPLAECERECRKHEKRDASFKESADACARCIEECKKA